MSGVNLIIIVCLGSGGDSNTKTEDDGGFGKNYNQSSGGGPMRNQGNAPSQTSRMAPYQGNNVNAIKTI